MSMGRPSKEELLTNPEFFTACKFCGRTIKKTNLRAHQRKQHGVLTHPNKGRKQRHVEAVAQMEVEQVDVMEVCMLVLETLFPDGVPVHKLALMIEWVETTKRLAQ